MDLSSIFSAVAHKVFVAVDLPGGSNQHEINGTEALRQFFSTSDKIHGPISWRYFADDHDPIRGEDEFTFYDSRAKSAERTGRSEWRFYYYSNFLEQASVGDRLLLVRAASGDLFGLIFQDGSSWLRSAQKLFGIEVVNLSFDYVSREELETKPFELLGRQIVEEMGLELAVPVPGSDEELMLQTYGRAFPSTYEMAQFARSQVEVNPNQPDDALLSWLNREEELFRALENVIIRERLDTGFESVDQFIEYSLSVQNRRKSRMGWALQHHLAELFTQHRLAFTAQGRSEGNSRPDFVFPSIDQYHDPAFNAELLVMLGVKSSAKDRWRQVLDEADRIRRKHLCTLEPGISVRQTTAMANRLITLVIPAELQITYTDAQQRTLMNIEQFIGLVRQKQSPST